MKRRSLSAKPSKFIVSFMALLMIGSAQTPDEPKEVSLGQEFKLAVEREARIKDEGLLIRFSSVMEDSRCPEGVNCIWSGNAKIRIGLSKPGRESSSVELNTDVDPKIHSYYGYKVRLIDLIPHPKATESTPAEKQHAILVISKTVPPLH